MNPAFTPSRPATLSSMDSARLTLSVADASEREHIGRLRHEIYARELGQHPVNSAARLPDAPSMSPIPRQSRDPRRRKGCRHANPYDFDSTRARPRRQTKSIRAVPLSHSAL